MKHPFLCAIFFISTTFPAFARSDGGRTVRQQVVIRETAYVLPDSINTRSAAEARSLAPVAERVSRANLATARPTYSGILPRVATAREPAEMISPFAPRDYGAGWNLVSMMNRDPYRNVTPRSYHPQPIGVRVLGIRGIW